MLRYPGYGVSAWHDVPVYGDVINVEKINKKTFINAFFH